MKADLLGHSPIERSIVISKYCCAEEIQILKFHDKLPTPANCALLSMFSGMISQLGQIVWQSSEFYLKNVFPISKFVILLPYFPNTFLMITLGHY